MGQLYSLALGNAQIDIVMHRGMGHVYPLSFIRSGRDHFRIDITQVGFGRVTQSAGGHKLDAFPIDPCPSFRNRKNLRSVRQRLVNRNKEAGTNVAAIAGGIAVIPRNGNIETFQIRRCFLGRQLTVIHGVNRIKCRAGLTVGIKAPFGHNLPAPRARLALASLAPGRVAQGRVLQLGNNAFLKMDADRHRAGYRDVHFAGRHVPDKAVEKNRARRGRNLARHRVDKNLRPLHDVAVLEKRPSKLGDFGIDYCLLLVLLRALGPEAVAEKNLLITEAFVKTIVVVVNFCRHNSPLIWARQIQWFAEQTASAKCLGAKFARPAACPCLAAPPV